MLFILLVMSLTSVSANAQNFVSSALPQDATTITVSESHVYAFVPGFLYYAPIAKVLKWQGLDTLPSSSPAVNAGFLEDKLFVLLQNNNLYSFVNGIWTLEKEGISGMAVNNHGVFAWNENNLFQYNYYSWIAEVECFNIRDVAVNGSQIFIVSGHEIYYGPTLNDLILFGETKIDIEKYLLTPYYYAYIGTYEVSDYAAYYISPLGVCAVPEAHVLTQGRLNDAAEYQGKVFISGFLGNKGVIFDAYDMSNINFFDESILGICSNDNTLIAWDTQSLYLSIDATASIQKQNINTNGFSLITNPVDDVLQVVSKEEIFLEIISLDGKKMGSVMLKTGLNQIDVSAFPVGTYILSSSRGATKFVVVK